LFDIDGTLIRTGGAGLRAFAQTAATVFQRPGGTESLTFHGRTDSSLVREFLRVNGLPDHPDNRERFLTSYLFLLDHQLQQHAGGLCPGVTRILAELPTLPSPPLIGLLTGNVRLGAILKLNAHSLTDHFVLGAFGDDHEDRNQLARIARDRACGILGQNLDGPEIVVVGDTPADIECAHAINARCVAVATGAIPLAELRRHRPALAVESLSGLHAGELASAALNSPPA
jgi:phosphoglycolate phosphatase-like HAD superfamily hydrolase